MEQRSATLVLIYGALLVLGGVMGFIKAGSLISLIFGTVFGGAVLLSAWGMFKKKREAIYAALILAFAIDALFTYRMMETGKLFPAGVICILSLVVIIVLALDIRKTKPKKR